MYPHAFVLRNPPSNTSTILYLVSPSIKNLVNTPYYLFGGQDNRKIREKVYHPSACSATQPAHPNYQWLCTLHYKFWYQGRCQGTSSSTSYPPLLSSSSEAHHVGSCLHGVHATSSSGRLQQGGGCLLFQCSYVPKNRSYDYRTPRGMVMIPPQNHGYSNLPRLQQ